MKHLAFPILVILVIALAALASTVLPESYLMPPTPTPPATRIPEQATRTPEPQPHQNPPEPTTSPVLVWAHSVNVHSQPELKAPIIGWLHQNDQITPEFCYSGWVHFISPELTGWVAGACLDPNPCGQAGSCNDAR